jgi:hypothetical protein
MYVYKINEIYIGMADEVEVSDFEDCLIDFMEDNFNVLIEDNSAKEVINKHITNNK